ncbi:lysophospholipid acyltransferase family protein [Lentibacillus saliphilus]|uniref:lysophospholipid acyltransferase family protein n=1 Tax=Lentibacillus saliphilus TaxID=2737028 RepID=UPI001C2FACB5|nr:lysophospholipid acyltransferase family protein [Lentibacillus saliphilus]
MFFSIRIYLYVIALVAGSWFKLKKAQSLFKQAPEDHTEFIFQTPKTVSRKVIHKIGTPVHVHGAERVPEGPVLYVANHQGIFDIVTFLGFLGRPVGFIAKKEIQKLPIISKWMELIHCVFMDRTDRRQSVKAIQQGIQHLKNGHSMVIFPEGTRSKTNELNEFKPGSLRLALKADVPIVPVAIDGTYEMLEAKNGHIQPSTVHIHLHDAIMPEAYHQLKTNQLAEMIQANIEQTLKQYEGKTEETDAEVQVNH